MLKNGAVALGSRLFTSTLRFGDLSSLYKMKHIDWLFHE
jgi:hypothetical protein